MKNQKLNLSASVVSTLIVILIGLLPQVGFAQNNNLKINFYNKHKTSFVYERALTPRTSLSIGLLNFNADYNKCWHCNNDVTYTNKGLRFETKYRLYIGTKGKKMNGFYLGPNLSIGKHKLNYLDKNRAHGSALGGLFGLFLDSLDGDIDLNHFDDEPRVPIKGSADGLATSIGLKLGYQKRWKAFNIDMGINFTKNSFGGDEGLKLDKGVVVPLEKDLNGSTTPIYIGLGFAF